MTDAPVQVCIVGAGPCGPSVLERVRANAGALDALRYLGAAGALGDGELTTFAAFVD